MSGERGVGEAGAAGSGGSVAFDRAADYYDDTRALPPEAQAALLDVVVPELAGRRVLEVGVGTGRWALPLASRGVDVVGVDLSLPMLRRLRAKPAGDAVAVAQADALTLPFADAAFGAGYMCHVLHLIPAWERAVGELLRCVARPGVVLADLGGSSALDTVISTAVGGRFDRTAGFRGLREATALDEVMRGHGASLRLLPGVSQRVERPLRMLLDGFRANQFSWTWGLSDAEREEAAERFEAWADAAVGGVDAIPYVDQEIAWRAYDLPA